jgi:glucose/mannose-6-phosphate isomerase
MAAGRLSVVSRFAGRQLGPEAVAAVDSTDQAAAMLALGRQLRHARELADAAGLSSVGMPRGLAVAGMGGSAIGARLAIGVLGDRLRRPVVVADGYELPPWVGPGTLVLCSSYSGATEETLTCYGQARERGAAVVVASVGGPLTARAQADGVPVIRLPGGLQPRAAVGYSLMCALAAAAACGAAPSLREELEPAARLLDELALEWGPAGDEHGVAKELARRLCGAASVVVGAESTAPVAYRWKCQLNENAKLPAFCSVLPEADHNEICGWEAATACGTFAAVFLEDVEHRPEIRRRVDITARAALNAGVRVARVTARGTTRLERVLSLVLLGDLVSLYLAVLRETDPVEIRAIHELKAALAVTGRG